MIKRISAILFGFLMGMSASAQTNTVTYNIKTGFNAIVNQVSAGENTLGDILGYNVPDQTSVFLYMPGQGYNIVTFMAGFGWFNELDGGTMTNGPQIVPGAGFFLYDPSTNFQITAVGMAVTPTLPVISRSQCGTFYFLGRQTNGIGTFENVTGLAPNDGDRVYVYDGIDETNISAPYPSDSDFAVCTFCGTGWTPNTPYLIPGQSAFFLPACAPTPCLTVQVSNLIVISTNAMTQVNFSPIITSHCDGIGGVAYFRPPSGSLFPPGTTPVHCVVADNSGDVTSADFTVTIEQPVIAAPTDSYTMGLIPGYNLVAYQFDNGGNTLREIMTNVPDGAVATKYLNGTSNWLQSTYSAALYAWIPGNITLRPGEGMFLFNPTTNFVQLTLFGHPHTPVLPITLTNGIELLSRQTNGVGTYSNIVGVATPPSGTRLFQLSDPSSSSNYNIFTFAAGHWTPFQPSNGVGQACWISRPGGPAPPRVPDAPVITQQPMSVVTSSFNPVTFSVAATGDVPLHYQWRLNGNVLIGQTNDTLSIPSVQSTNCGSYDVLVQNQIGIAQSTNVSITLLDLSPLPFNDTFANAGMISGQDGTGGGTNINATAETGEPTAESIPGGVSVWVKWQAPSDGVVTFTTSGSDFDTLLASYTGTDVTNLVEIAADDDGAGFLCSVIRFNVRGGTFYDIQVDGFYGDTGSIVLSWNLFQTEDQLPVIVQQPQSQTTAGGASNVVFDITALPVTGLTYQWLRNGIPIFGATNSAFSTNASIGTVGFYQCLVSNANGDGLFVVSQPADFQINIPAPGLPVNTGARAESKVQTIMDTTVRPGYLYDPPIVTGYSGVETFGMYDATAENPEPLHCGQTCYYTKWHSYLAPTAGLLSISDFGTTFSGVMGVYTGPDFSLVPLACSGGHPSGTEVVSFMAQSGNMYWISMSATNSAINGTVQLQYSMLAPPFYTLLPTSQSVINGSNNLTLTADTTGNPAVSYQWQLNGTNIQGATQSSYTIPTFLAANQGNYTVIATNTVGTNIFVYASLYLDAPLQFVNTTNLNLSNILFSQLICLPNSNYIFATSSDTINWTTNYLGSSSAAGIINITNTMNPAAPAKYYKAILPIIN